MTDSTLNLENRIPYMDILRGIAIFYIVAFHHLDDYSGHIYHNRLDDIITYAFLGVFIFISGYLLSISNPITNTKNLLDYALKRFLRIYPLYLLSLFLYLSCSLISFKSFLTHIFFMNVFLDNSVMTLWFVSIIFIFYFIYPVIIYQYNFFKTLIISVLFFVIVVFFKKLFGLFDKRLLIYFPFFLFGIIS